MDCLIYNNMKSCNKQWNTLHQLWNLLISIFHSSMEFHGTLPGQKGSFMEFHGTLKVPWNLMPTTNSMEFHGIARSRTKVPWKFRQSSRIILHQLRESFLCAYRFVSYAICVRLLLVYIFTVISLPVYPAILYTTYPYIPHGRCGRPGLSAKLTSIPKHTIRLCSERPD